MARPKQGGGRVTTPRPTHDANDEILPLRRRNPVQFWFIIVAVIAMWSRKSANPAQMGGMPPPMPPPPPPR